MANIAWQNLAFSPVKFDPTAGYTAAGDAFGNISDTLEDRKAAESLANFQQGKLAVAAREQDFREAAPQRAEELREANLARSAAQGLFADQVAGSAGGSHMQSVLAEAQNNPEYMAMSGPERADFAHQALQKNKRLFSDPTAYHKEVRTKLLESGDFSRQDADAISAQKTAEQFPTMDKDFAIKLFKKDSTGSASGSGGKAGKQLFTQESPRDRKEQRDNFFDLNEIGDKTANWYRMDPLDYNPTQQNVGTFLSDMGSGQDGVTQDNALAYLQTLMGNSGNVTSGHDIANLSKDDLAAFKTGARNMRSAKERTTGGTGAGSVVAQNASNQIFNQGLMDRMNPDQSSREKRLSTFFSGLPGGAKPNLTSDTIDVDQPVKAPAKEAPATGRLFAEEDLAASNVSTKRTETPEAELQRTNALLQMGRGTEEMQKRVNKLEADIDINNMKLKLDSIDELGMITAANGDIISPSGQIFMTAKEKQEAELATKSK